MKFFTPAYFEFFDQLKENNNKEWFDLHRTEYEKNIKKPFRDFFEKLTKEVVKLDPKITCDPSKCIFRINRDIRFSKDKTPYKIHQAGVFAEGGKKSEMPCYYLHIGQEDVLVGGGMYFVSKENLEKIRQEILYNEAELNRILSEKKFKKNYNVNSFEQYKVLPKEYQEMAKKQPILYNKRFYSETALTRKDVLADGFDELVLEHYRTVKPYNDFLWEAILD